MKSRKFATSFTTVVLAVTSGLVGVVPPAGAHGVARAAIKACRIGPGGQLAYAGSPSVSRWTQSNPVEIVLRNRSKVTCLLHGFPTITIGKGSGRVYPFTYNHLTAFSAHPLSAPTVTIKPGGSAVFLTNNITCNDRPFNDVAMTWLHFTTPGSKTAHSIKTSRYTYCSKDKGASTIVVSPFAPNEAWIYKYFLQ